MTFPIILASSSPYRCELLSRLHIPFESQSPDVDETRLKGESADEYVRRLSLAKAEKIAESHPNAVIIGSDQCAVLNGEILGKPGSHDQALKQLQNAQGQSVVFHTGLCVRHVNGDFELVDNIRFSVEFRRLTDEQLEHYLAVEQPYNCAGSFKSEAYGSVLFEKMSGDDPTALVGLPLIRLTRMLEEAGVSVV